ncbi:MAG: helix-turn-helix domain-containing protein [Patescibacteria group bacterium]|nr:helix-turn-helix domain-containing protein [Patescibacteria group bacterium]
MFSSKKLDQPVRVCHRLKKIREELGLSLEFLSKTTRIPQKYLEAIEDCRFAVLPPAKIYRLSYIREYASALNLDAEEILSKFRDEEDVVENKIIHPRADLKFFPFNSVAIMLRSITILVLVAVFAGYLGWEVRGILQAPKLFVFTPIEGSIVNKYSAQVRGETEKEVNLTINGQEVRANEEGKFDATIDLSLGVNTIVITAIKKHGKTSEIIRHVVVKEIVDKVSYK